MTQVDDIEQTPSLLHCYQDVDVAFCSGFTACDRANHTDIMCAMPSCSIENVGAPGFDKVCNSHTPRHLCLPEYRFALAMTSAPEAVKNRLRQAYRKA